MHGTDKCPEAQLAAAASVAAGVADQDNQAHLIGVQNDSVVGIEVCWVQRRLRHQRPYRPREGFSGAARTVACMDP